MTAIMLHSIIDEEHRDTYESELFMEAECAIERGMFVYNNDM